MPKRYISELIISYTVPPEAPPGGAASNTGPVLGLIGRIMYALGRTKSSTGNWYDAPATTLEDAKSHQDSTDGTAHGGVVNRVQDHGVDVAKHRKINFTGSGVTVTPDPAGDRTNVSISGGGEGGGADHNLLSTTHLDTASTDTPADGDVVRRVSGVWEASPVTEANVAPANVDGANETPSMRSLGTSAGMALPGNHPSVHNRSHTILDPTDHTDVAADQVPQDGDTLKWDSTTSKFEVGPILSFISPQFLDGLELTWDAGDILGVESGACYIPEVGIRELPERVTVPVVFPASSVAFHHVYAYDNSGSMGIEYSTDAPVPYRGRARERTGTAGRRYLGSILPNGAATPAMLKWVWQGGDWIEYLQNVIAAPLLLTDSTTGRATTETTISASAVVPITSRRAKFSLSTNSSSYFYFGNSEDVLLLSSSAYLFRLVHNNGNIYQLEATLPLDSTQSFTYMAAPLPPAGTGLVTRLQAYQLTRR